MFLNLGRDVLSEAKGLRDSQMNLLLSFQEDLSLLLEFNHQFSFCLLSQLLLFLKYQEQFFLFRV
jgi:hypothetical protein